MIRYLLLSVLILLLSPVESIKAQSSSIGTAIYRELQNNHLLENYMIDTVKEIAGTVIEAAREWPGVLVNQPYQEDMINLYLIDSERLTKANILERYNVNLTKSSLYRNAMAHEETQILFVDTGLVKSLVTTALLQTQHDMDQWIAVASINARGISAFKQYWDPNINTKLTTARYADQWVMLAFGALAFNIAHEVGHIAIGKPNFNKRRSLLRFDSKEDRDKSLACINNAQDRYRQQQAIEQEVDEYAVSLLGKILFPPEVFRKSWLRFELGAHWYIVYSIATQMVKALHATESMYIHALLKSKFGPEVYNELIARKKNIDKSKGSVRVFFPKSHPAAFRRLSISLDKLAQSPHSLYQGSSSSTQANIMIFEMFLKKECQNLKTKYGN